MFFLPRKACAIAWNISQNRLRASKIASAIFNPAANNSSFTMGRSKPIIEKIVCDRVAGTQKAEVFRMSVRRFCFTDLLP